MKKVGNRPRYIFRSIVLPGILFALLAAVLIMGVMRFNSLSREQDRQLTLAAIRKATVQCYADEGRYPSDVDYLIAKYGIDVDEDEFYVSYDCLASNVFPNIAVYYKGEDAR